MNINQIFRKIRMLTIKRFLLGTMAGAVATYILIVYLGHLHHLYSVMSLTDLDKCPACYGVSVCSYLSDKISLNVRQNTVFNAKNIYYGVLVKGNHKILIKKLAHAEEFQSFDATLCQKFNLDQNCKPADLLKVPNMLKKIIKHVEYNVSAPSMEPRKGIIMCPHAEYIENLLEPLFKFHINQQTDLINIWTMLNINPEPIMLQILQRSDGWPVPAFGGVCGRMEVVSYEGIALTYLTDVPMTMKMFFAQQIIAAALDFTYRHDKYRFYLMDWSLDNIVADRKGFITFVDLEDVIVVEKYPKDDNYLNKEWATSHTHEHSGDSFEFSISDLCSHRLSDFNLWAACYVIGGGASPLLSPLKQNSRGYHDIFTLLNECLMQPNRQITVTRLLTALNEIVEEDLKKRHAIVEARNTKNKMGANSSHESIFSKLFIWTGTYEYTKPMG